MTTLVMGAPKPKSPSPTALTPREREVLRWVRECKSNWETGKIVGCSDGTVKKHLQHIFRKLGVSNRMAAAKMPSTSYVVES